MANLLKDFFKRDLTTQEWVDLEEQLSGSTKDSLRFAQLAKKFYLGLGLPDPEGPHGSSGAGPHSIGGLILKSLVGLSLLGAISWLVWSHTHPAPKPEPPPLIEPKVQEPPPRSIAPKPVLKIEPAATKAKPQVTSIPAEKPTAFPKVAPTATQDNSPGGLFQNGFHGQDVHQ